MEGKSILESIISKYRAQIGETVFHAFTGKEHIEPKTKQFYSDIEPILSEKFGDKPFKVLELAPSKNFVGPLIAENFDADVTLMDMSKQALIDGSEIAISHGLKKSIRRVAGDFHDLPFPSGSFDFVYMSGAIHHTRTPEAIFKEIARVLKPNGLFNLINEPCKRQFSLYAFNGNREGGGGGPTKFERALIDDGILGLLQYPIEGGRPEDLFGMIENWSISVDFFINSQTEHFNLLQDKYKWGPLTEFEQHVWDLKDQPEAEIFDFIEHKVRTSYEKLISRLSEKDKLMGFYLPELHDVMSMSKKVIGLLRAADNSADEVTRNRYMTNIFGGRITALYQRNSNPSKPKIHSELIDDGTIPYTPMAYEGATLDIANQLLPSIQDKKSELLVKSYFGETDWEVITEADGVILSCINNNSEAKVNLSDTYKNVVLCIRLYCIEAENPYFIDIYNNETKVDEHAICQSETRCTIHPFETLEGNITFRLRDKDNEPLSLKGFLRVGVFQLLQVTAQ